MAIYIGMDVHKKFTVAVAMTENGELLGEQRIEHGASIARVPWGDYLKGFPERPHVALEATGFSYPIYEAIEPYCRSVVMSHPMKTKLIAEQKVKTDTIDGTTLAHLYRADFLPTSYIPSREIRDHRELLRHRIVLVQIQTSIKNRIHAVLARCGEFYEGTDLFGKAGRQYLAEMPLRDPYRQELDRFLQLLDGVASEIKQVTRTIHREVEICPAAMQLTTVYGIGNYLAALIYWEIGDINRFAKPSKLVGYAGLGPSVYSSGGKTFYGPITKQGNRFLRWALVEAAQKYGKRQGPVGDSFRRVWRKKGAKAARVATARKLLTIIWHMLKKGENFDESKIARDRQRFKALDVVAQG